MTINYYASIVSSSSSFPRFAATAKKTKLSLRPSAALPLVRRSGFAIRDRAQPTRAPARTLRWFSSRRGLLAHDTATTAAE